MKRNTLLRIAVALCKILKAIFIFFIIALTVLFIHFQIDRSHYSGSLNISKDRFLFSTINKWKDNTTKDYKDIFIIKEIKRDSLYLGYFKLIAVIIVLFLGVREFQKIMESVKEVKTFDNDNVSSFRRIGIYILIYVILTSYNSIRFEHGGIKSFGISFAPLLLILIAFIMAEIFKEGVLLKQENDLTI